MSADPFANTTTVKNILQHVISPKIVKDGSGGYVTKTDLVNVDNLVFTPHIPLYKGTPTNPVTSQCGTAGVSGGTSPSASLVIHHARVSPDSVILACVRSIANNNVFVINVFPDNKQFTITLSTNVDIEGAEVVWFIAAF
jgi:hypothetical protein